MGLKPFSLKFAILTTKRNERRVLCCLRWVGFLTQNVWTYQFSTYRPCPPCQIYLTIQHTLQYQHTYHCCRVGHTPNAVADPSMHSRWPSNDFCQNIRIRNSTITSTQEISLQISLLKRAHMYAQ